MGLCKELVLLQAFLPGIKGLLQKIIGCDMNLGICCVLMSVQKAMADLMAQDLKAAYRLSNTPVQDLTYDLNIS